MGDEEVGCAWEIVSEPSSPNVNKIFFMKRELLTVSKIGLKDAKAIF